jgi:hypothetical protein
MSHNKRNACLLNMSIGYMGYTNDLMGIDDYQLTGNTLGFAFDFGYDIGISENLMLGFKLSAISGTLFEYEIHDGSKVTTIELEEGEYEGLGRFDLSIGLRFAK